MRTQACPPGVRRGRLRKAERFLEAADIVRELADEHGDIADAYVTLCVHAGIASADVICCARLGEHAQGENHNEATGLLKQADSAAARHLSTLLNLKTKSGYSSAPVTLEEFKKAGRAAEALIGLARASVAALGN